MIEIKNQDPEDAVFNTLLDMRSDIKQLFMKVPDTWADDDRVAAVYNNNMAIFKVLDVLDKYLSEVI